MNKIIKCMWLIFYYMVAKQLPSSFYPLGGIFNRCRVIALKRIIKIEYGCKIQRNVYIGDGNNIEIGRNCQINENVRLDNVTIGNYVMIAPGVTILGKLHEYSNIEVPMILQGNRQVNKTVIHDDVWIGTNAVIMPGVVVHRGSIIASGAVVTKDCEPLSVYGGVPARLLKSRLSVKTLTKYDLKRKNDSVKG